MHICSPLKLLLELHIGNFVKDKFVLLGSFGSSVGLIVLFSFVFTYFGRSYA